MRGSKRSKINETGCQLDPKIKEKIDTNLASSISGTKCDGDKPLFSADRGDQSDCDEG